MTRSRIAAIIGGAIGVAGLAFVVRLFLQRREETGALLQRVDLVPVLGAFVLGLIGMAIIGLSWNRLLALLDRPIPTGVALRSYFVGQLGKYVPGGVWAVVGRGEWARRHGVTGMAAYSSTVLSMVTAYLGAAVLAVVVVPLSAPLREVHPLSLLVMAVGVIGVPLLHPRVMGWALRVLRRVTGRTLELRLPPFHSSLAVVAVQVVTWLAIGTGTWLIARGLGAELTWLVAVAATCTSWVIGMLVVPVPGGIGVREGALVALLSDVPEAAAIALAARLVAVAVDAAGAAVTTMVEGAASTVRS